MDIILLRYYFLLLGLFVLSFLLVLLCISYSHLILLLLDVLFVILFIKVAHKKYDVFVTPYWATNYRSATADISSFFSLYSLFIHLSCILLTFSISSYIVLPVDKSSGGAGLTLPLQRCLGDYPTFS